MKLSKTILILSLVSMIADIASESLYPVIPLYLNTIGVGAIYIGFLEGIANLISGLSKSYFGRFSDSVTSRMPFIIFGYSLSTIGRSFLAIIPNPLWVIFMRSTDRLGKGMRTSARDAMLSEEGDHSNQGAIFGFHRAMDTTGAVMGPILGLWLLHIFKDDFSKIFLMSLVPGLLSLALLRLVKEKKRIVKENTRPKISFVRNFLDSLKYWKVASQNYKNISVLVFLFTLINSSDMFLLLKAKQNGASDHQVILLYIIFNLVYAVSSFPLGKMSDHFGRKKVFLFGMMCFAVMYFGINFSKNFETQILLFSIYGLFNGATEGVMKAWIVPHCKKEDLGWALGFQGSMVSVMAFFSSFLAGMVWQFLGQDILFLSTGTLAVLLLIVFGFKKGIH